ncbi:MAG: hypothetical protein EAZ99_12905 [Alphaproteobacteria bacterium]|nr:MAG: hypothetical protein EAZ99_12905 [Alphaproteobacteria bacterium]
MIKLRLSLIGLLLIAAAFSGAPLYAQTPPPLAAAPASVIGYASIIEQTVRSRKPSQSLTQLALNDVVVFDEQITTGSESRAVITFRDGGVLELGPNGVATIDRFVFDPQSGQREKAISIQRGLFRMTSGAPVANSSITLRTPIATIGIRGSVVSGIVPSDPLQPTVIVGGTGQFEVTTGGGTVGFGGGQSTVISSAQSAPLPPTQVPAFVAATVVQAVTGTLGNAPPPPQPPTGNTASVIAQANAQPASQQRAVQAQPTQSSQPTPPPQAGGGVGVPPAVQTAAIAGLLTGQPLTQQQQQLAVQLGQSVPNAQQVVTTFAAAQASANQQSIQAAQQQVVSGLSQVLTPQQLQAVQQQIQAVVPTTPATSGQPANAAPAQQTPAQQPATPENRTNDLQPPADLPRVFTASPT